MNSCELVLKVGKRKKQRIRYRMIVFMRCEDLETSQKQWWLLWEEDDCEVIFVCVWGVGYVCSMCVGGRICV